MNEVVDTETGEIIESTDKDQSIVVRDLTEIPVGATQELVSLKKANKSIIDDQQNKTRHSHSILKKMYVVYREGLWAADTNYTTMIDWLGDLYRAGVDYTATATFYDKMEFIEVELELHGNLDRAITMAIKYDGLHKKAEEAGLLEVVKDKEGINADYTGTHITEAGKEMFGEDGYEKMSKVIASLPKGERHDYVNKTFGVPTIKVTSLVPWAGAIEFDIKNAPTLLGELQIEDEEGNTPFQFAIIIERGADKRIIEAAGKRMKSNFRLLK